MRVAVVHASAAAQDCVAVELPEGATVAEAIRRSGLVAAWNLDLADLVAAVRGRVVATDARLADGDRVELLRPVTVDPKDVRRRRAAARSRRKNTAAGGTSTEG